MGPHYNRPDPPISMSPRVASALRASLHKVLTANDGMDFFMGRDDYIQRYTITDIGAAAASALIVEIVRAQAQSASSTNFLTTGVALHTGISQRMLPKDLLVTEASPLSRLKPDAAALIALATPYLDGNMQLAGHLRLMRDFHKLPAQGGADTAPAPDDAHQQALARMQALAARIANGGADPTGA